MNEEKLSVRQLAVTAFAGGLAPAAAGAGYGWQGALLAAPVLVLAGWGLSALAPRWGRLSGRWQGRALALLYALWGTALLARGLGRCARRVVLTGGGTEEQAPWLILLLALPLAWMVRSKAAAFFRGAEVCYLAAGAVAAGLLLWAAFRMDWHFAALPAASLWEGARGAVETGGTFLFLLPFIDRTLPQPGGGGKTVGWLAALLGVGVLFALTTAGVLSPTLAAGAEAPFFLMTAALGRSARMEGLVSALWLLPDLVYLGLLAQSWRWAGLGKSWLPVGAVAAGALTACFGLTEVLPAAIWAWGTVALGAATAVVLMLSPKK